MNRPPSPVFRSAAPLFAAIVLAAAGTAGCATAGSLFGAPEPEILWTGTAPGAPAGVIVIRDLETFDEATEPLVPDFPGTPPDLDRRTVLRVVSRPLGTACGTTGIDEISTSAMRATVAVQEQLPPPGCRCDGGTRPPRAWLISVGRAVRRAEVVARTVEVPCDAARAASVPVGPELVLEGSWDEEPGARIVADQPAWDDALRRLGVAGRGPGVDFATQSLLVVTGRPRSNGCRRTLAVDASLSGSGEAVVTVEETYPGPGTMCTQVFRLPKVFVYRVPRSVETARVVTREVR